MTSGTVELVPEEIQPQQTVAELEKHYALRASATTPIDKHSTEDRNNNIRRCFQLISGTVLQPGKTFSFNKTVGERTIANGFFPAIEYINDEHVEGIGGGACQASTTVYQAAVCAGMQIISRRPHSDSVSYAEYGKDATVYMGGKQIDMVFKNTTEEPIYITAEVLNDPSNKNRLMAKVSIYGADTGNEKYTLETETVEVLPSILEPVYVSEKESAANAKDGCIVNSYRVTYTDGVMTNRELLFKDTYNPKPAKIYDPLLAEQ
jgi:vancomycin resistance protein YoaR